MKQCIHFFVLKYPSQPPTDNKSNDAYEYESSLFFFFPVSITHSYRSLNLPFLYLIQFLIENKPKTTIKAIKYIFPDKIHAMANENSMSINSTMMYSLISFQFYFY